MAHVSEEVLDTVSPATLEELNPVDGGPIYTMYLKRAEEEDKRTAEGWKEEAEKVFLFTGLFSAVVASFVSVSIQDIQANPLDTSNFYLAGIHHALTSSGSNLSSISLASPPPFTPPTFGIWVNSLWTLSLVISMTCAVLANLIQQWARKYLTVTQPRSAASIPRQARYRAFYAITFARLIALARPSSETAPAVASETTALGAPPAAFPAPDLGAATEDDVNHALEDPRSSSVPSLTDSKGAEAGPSLELDVERATPPVSQHGDNMV